MNQLPFYPYPSDPVTRFGFIVGDMITIGVLCVILIPALSNFFR